MSTFTAIAIMVGLAFVQRFLYGFDDRWIQNRRDAIVSGIIGGRPASTQDRWTLVYTGWTGAVAGAVGVQVAAAARPRKKSACVKAHSPAMPICSKLRRPSPSQYGLVRPALTRNMFE